jgi:serine protease Do
MAKKATPISAAWPIKNATPAAFVDNETKMDVNIADLAKKVNAAVATVLTYDSGTNLFRQGSGFFINQDGDFITNFHVLKGAYTAVIKIHSEIEYRAVLVLAADEKAVSFIFRDRGRAALLLEFKEKGQYPPAG